MPAGRSFAAAPAGDYQVTFTASDGVLSISEVVDIHVGDLTYPDLPSGAISLSLAQTIQLHFSTGPCQTGGQRQVLGSAPDVEASCQLTGANPGRVMVSCTLAIPQFAEPNCLGSFDTSYGSYFEPETGQATGPLLGNELFAVSGGSPAADNWSWSGTVPGGALQVQSVLINVGGSDQLYCSGATDCQ
jgi:hypothetical protein